MRQNEIHLEFNATKNINVILQSNTKYENIKKTYFT